MASNRTGQVRRFTDARERSGGSRQATREKGGAFSEPTPAEALATLFDQYGDEIFRHVRFMVGSTPDAEDLVQDIFLRALRAWPRFQRRSSPRTWLWAITRNVLKEYRRQRDREVARTLRLEPERAAGERDPSDQFVWDDALAALSDSQRQVFVLRVVEDQSSREAAALLGWPEVRVRVTLYRALRRLEVWWNGGGKSHGG